MKKQTFTLFSIFLALAVALSACGIASPAETTVPESEAGITSKQEVYLYFPVIITFVEHRCVLPDCSDSPELGAIEKVELLI